MSAQPKPETVQATRDEAVAVVYDLIASGYGSDAMSAAQAILLIDQADAVRRDSELD